MGRGFRPPRRGLRAIPRIAGEVARAFGRPLDVVLRWPIAEILLRHEQAAIVLEDLA